MTTTHGRTEGLGGTTVAVTIRCDDPVLRPGRPRRVWALVSRSGGASAAPEVGTFEVTFHYGAVWDVGRIARPLELRYEAELQPQAELDLAS